MVLYRGLADDLRLQEWLEKYIFPAEAKTVSREMVRAGTRLAALEMIQSGTTAYADMYYFEEEIARATKAAGMRGVLGQTIIQFPVADAKSPQEGLARTEAFIKEFANGRSDRARCRAAFAVHRSTPRICSPRAPWQPSTACRCSSTSPKPRPSWGARRRRTRE